MMSTTQAFVTTLALFNVFILLSFPNISLAASYKHVAVAPELMLMQRLPDATATRSASHATMLRLEEGNIFLEGAHHNSVTIFAENLRNWQLRLNDVEHGGTITEAELVPGSGILHQSPILQSFTLGRATLQSKTIDLPKATTGKLQVKLLSLDAESPQQEKTMPQGFVIIEGDSRYKLVTQRNTQFSKLNQPLYVTAHMVHSLFQQIPQKILLNKQPMAGAIKRAYAEITLPDSSKQYLPLQDKGKLADTMADDGIFSAALPSHKAGDYLLKIYVQGVRPDGIAFSRTSYDIYHVIDSQMQLASAAARLVPLDSGKLALQVPLVNANMDNIFVASELWTKNILGISHPLVWIGGISNIVNEGGEQFVLLGLDERWLHRINHGDELQLRNIRIQDVNTHVPLDEKADYAVKVNQQILSRLHTTLSVDMPIVEDMFSMPAPHYDKHRQVAYLPNLEPQTTTSGLNAEKSLVLVHGYCEEDVWNENEFTDAYEYKDYNNNRTHDEFANRLLEDIAGLSRYSMIAHSQGGAVALHIYAKYHSGLDLVGGGRKIQSLGTPYQGTALAGILAAIGEIFGIRCGPNTDLTYAGAANWLSTIPGWARAEVDYYTTSFTDNWWSIDYCDLKMGKFLSDPDDGIVEQWAGQLPGGVNRGHKTGWCHAVDMREPAQYNDTQRNQIMDMNAAR